MDVVMLCESAEMRGGAEYVAISEALALRRQGFRVGYFAASQAADPWLESSGVELQLSPTRSFYEETDGKLKLQKLFSNPQIRAPLRQFLSQFSPKQTVVHCHGFSLKLTSAALEVSQELGFRVILHAHDYGSVCPNALLFDHRKEEVCTLGPGSVACFSTECQGEAWKYKLPKSLNLMASAAALRKLSGVIHVSQMAKSYLQPSLPPIRLQKVILSPIDGENLIETPCQPSRSQAIMAIGRLAPEKGLRSLLEACPNATIVGDGPERESLVRDYPLATFTGWLPQDEVQSQLRSARCLVVPSLWLETYGLNVVNAMQAGVPVICSDRVGAKEWIEDGKNGLVYPAGNPSELRQCLEMIRDDAFVDGLGQAAFETLRQNPPTMSRHLLELIEFYDEVLHAVA